MAETDSMPERYTERNDHVHGGGAELIKTVLAVMKQMQLLESKLDEHAERFDKGLHALNDKIDFLTEQFNRMTAERNNNPRILIHGEIDPEQQGHGHMDPKLRNSLNEFLEEPGEYRSRQSSADSGFVHVSNRTKRYTVSETTEQTLDENQAGSTTESVEIGYARNKGGFDRAASGIDYNRTTKSNDKTNANNFQTSSYSGEKPLNRNAGDKHNSSRSVNNDRRISNVSMKDIGAESDSNDSDITDSESSTNSTKASVEQSADDQNKVRVRIEPVVVDSDSGPDNDEHGDKVQRPKGSGANKTDMETDDDMLKQLQPQIQDKLENKITHDEGELQPPISEPQKTEQFKDHLQQDSYEYRSERQQHNRFTDNQDNFDENDSPSLGNDSKASSRKRAHALNFGSLNSAEKRSTSPQPFCRKRKVATYSCFKKMKTYTFEDNRQKYLDRVYDFQKTTGDAILKDQEVPELRTSADKHQEPNSFSGSSFQNNQQIPISGLKNEHGQFDNRFVEEAHTDAAPRSLQQCQFRNWSIIQPNSPISDTPEKVNQTSVASHSLNQINERKMNQCQASSTVSDNELHLLVKKEQQDAKDCSDPKSLHGIDTVICLDVSASMAGEPLENAKQFIINFLEGLDESAADHSLEENVALVTFGSQNRILQHLTNNYDLIRNSFGSLEADGPSPLWLGIGLCLTELSERGGSCTMDSLKVLPRIIILSDYLSSIKNRLAGPDIQTVDQKGNNEVAGIVDKNKNSVCLFDFVVVGENVNQGLLASIAEDRQFTVDDVLYLSQFFRAQDTVNIVLSEMVGNEVNEDFVKNLMRNRGMTHRSEKDIMALIRDRTSTNEDLKRRNKSVSPMSTSITGERAAVDVSGELAEQSPVVTIDDVVEPAFGSHVKANPDWVGYHTRCYLLGTVIAPRKQGCLKILWEDGTQERLKYGVNGEYCVILDDGIHDVIKDGIRIGTVVERGHDWRWGEQDGGLGNPGVVCSYDPKKKVVNVLWEKGGQGNYRYGYKSCYDVAIRSEVQNERDETEKHFYWQIQLEDENWVFFAPEVNKTIEKRYQSKDKSTFLVDIVDNSYRISFNSMTARSTSKCPDNHAIQRLELTSSEWRSMSNET